MQVTGNDFSRRDALALLAVAGATAMGAAHLSAQPPQPLRVRSPRLTLRQRADAKNLLVGAAVRGRQLAEDSRLAKALRADANILVPEVELKWSLLQPKSPDDYNFGPAEQVYAFAKANDMAMRGHTLTWYRSEPDWAPARIADMSPAQAEALLSDYIRTVVGHWRGRVSQWDVANEAIDGDRKLTEPLSSKKLGEKYLDIAFHTAHEADPGTMLVFNTDLIEMDDPYQERHRVATLELLGRLLKRGVPVHALGIEGHIAMNQRFSETVFRKFLDEVTGMGLKLMITEFDVSDRGITGSIEHRDAACAAVGKAFLDVALSYRQCAGLLTWALSDRYSWLRTDSSRQRGDGVQLRPSPLDDNFQRKPLWNAIASAIDAAPKR